MIDNGLYCSVETVHTCPFLQELFCWWGGRGKTSLVAGLTRAVLPKFTYASGVWV